MRKIIKGLFIAALVLLFNPLSAVAFQTKVDSQDMKQARTHRIVQQRLRERAQEREARVRARLRARWQSRLATTSTTVPYVSSDLPSVSGCLTATQVASYARGAGFPEDVISAMVAIAYRESHYCPGAINRSSGACGLWQMYPCPGPEALNAATNAAMAYSKYQASGLSPWGY